MRQLWLRDNYHSNHDHTFRKVPWDGGLALFLSLLPVISSTHFIWCADSRQATCVPQQAARRGGLGDEGGRLSQHTLEPQSALWKSLSEDVYQVVYEGQRGQLAKRNIFLAH